ncbi:ATPase [Jannaschia pagri]|uniref:ATPase n=1 Tax=Jannaschia pagri TaxID=2829797 RepID=A0ABQ4NHQ4_9RHOB|nr:MULTISPECIES: TIGR02302 family protein [unclassified Jannaschia]GIT90068.1 ATPase [Jannaschia sp. AI_61]GIT93826.1 ATPase [Jannaschia sp. AI_62]
MAKDKQRDGALLRKLRLTHMGMWAERIARSFWPAWTAAILGLAVWSADAVPPLWSVTLLGLLALATVILLVVGLRGFRRPTAQDARDRLDATLPERPLATLDDDQAIGAGDAASAAVWAAHQRRMADRLSAARAVSPDLRVSRRDPYALRYVALLLAAVGLTFGTVLRVPEVPTVAGPAAALATGPTWEGWLEPPRYTGLPTLALSELDPGVVEVPEGTRVTLRLYGEVGALAVTETVSGRDITEPSAPIQDFTVVQSGTLSIDGGAEAPLWTLTATPDSAPEIALDGEPGFEHPDLVTLPWRAGDDYGVVSAEVTIALNPDASDRAHGLAAAPEPREPLTLDMALPISGDRSEVIEIFRGELTKHPFAGMPVTTTLRASDAAEQTGETVQDIILPGRAFYDRVAAALIEQRRDLFWSLDNQTRVTQILRAITWKADEVFNNPSAFLVTRMALRRLEADTLTPETRDEVAEMLWEAAIRLEENSLDSALERLRQAQERLSEAIRQGASPEEIARLTEEMRQAMDEYTRQLAQQQPQQGQQSQQQAQNGESQEITPDMLDQMMERIEELMRQGRTAEAQELLQQLQEMMENLQVTQGQPGQGGEGQQGQGQQAMEGLRDQLREQQGLSDDAFRELQEQFNPDAQAGESSENQGRSGGQGSGQQHTDQGGQSDQPQGQQGEGQDQAQNQGQGGAQQGENGGAEALARRQEALRQQLGDLRNNLPGAGTESGQAARDALGRAERAMREAERDLAEGNLGGALDDQAQAMDALRDGMQELGRALAEEQQGERGENRGQASSQEGDGFRRDPLGRQSGEGAQLGTDESLLGDGPDAARRARDLMDEIRRRSGERERPEVELDYLRRLLDRF